MTPASHVPSGAALLACALGAMLGLTAAPPVSAQQPPGARPAGPVAPGDTAHVTYRTTEVLFISAGRTAGLAVGDAITIESANGRAVAHAVVLSVADHSASAAPTTPNATVAVGELVRFVPRAGAALAAAGETPTPSPAAPAPVAPALSDTGRAASAGAAAPAASAASPVVAVPTPRLAPHAPAARWRAMLQLNQSASSAGGPSALTTYQTNAAAGFTAPLASWLRVQGRATTRWRSGASALSALGLAGSTTIVYQLEARVAPAGGWWNFSLGRFLPADAPGIGYLDGARLEVQPSASQRIGLVAGYAPDPYTMSPSSQMAQAAAYWGVSNPSFSGSVSGATQWQWSRIRRAWMSAQAFWTPSRTLSFSLLTDVDHGGGWQSFRGLQLTDLTAGVRTALPWGFRGGLTVETHAALRLFSSFLAGDTLALPGRLNELTASLGHDWLGASVEATAGYLKRASDATPTWQGTLSIYSRRLMIVAMGQRGDLLNFGSLMVRVPLPSLVGPFTAAIGFGANVTTLPSGAMPMWRYDLRPELGLRLGAGLYLSATADIGQYAGLTSTYVQAGVGYQLW